MKIWTVLAATGLALTAQARLSPENVKRLPTPVDRPVDFKNDVSPILEASCVKCHGRGKAKGGFRLDNRALTLAGGDSGPAVIVGNSAESYLIELVSGLNPDDFMPQKGSRLKPEQVAVLRAWIDQGLKWDDGVSFAKVPARNLTPTRPALPGPEGRLSSDHPIDRFLGPYFAAHNFTPPAPVADRVFARRAWLDVVGLLPSPEELQEFTDDDRENKRAALVDRLLGENRAYAAHWLSFWNDALRNDYRGTGYIDGGRKQITGWLFATLAENLPYDQFVAKLVNPSPENEGFIRGIVWRGAVNSSQTPAMQAAQNVSQVFMGINLKCASCHDSFIDDWTLADAYALANVFSDQHLELYRCDKPTGIKAGTAFLYPELGTIQADASRAQRLEQLAAIMTGKNNGRLSRTIVNRLWAKFFGRGLVEPVDQMDQAAWNQPLLDWLAEDLVAHNYDLKHCIHLILTSRAYQLLTVDGGETTGNDYVFRGPLVRRMSAEQFRDALTLLTGVGYAKPVAKVDWVDAQAPAAKNFRSSNVRWIWSQPEAASKARAETVSFRKRFYLAAKPGTAAAVITADNGYTLYVNGKKLGTGKDFAQPDSFDLGPHLLAGENTIAMSAVNSSPDNTPPTRDKNAAGGENPAGLLFWARATVGGALVEIVSDETWLWSTNASRGWELAEFHPDGWGVAVAVGAPNAAPWQVEAAFLRAIQEIDQRGRVRAALANADALTTALGRPNREQVVTSRSSAATTLQALELTNGRTLAELLEAGGRHHTAGLPPGAVELSERLYRLALGRSASDDEQKLAAEILGEPVRPEAVEDFLWTLAMLPEFQLIY